jgi:hypothetical protein
MAGVGHVYANGGLELHVENDGHAFLRHGAQARDEWVTLDYIKARWPQCVAQIEAAIAALPLEQED